MAEGVFSPHFRRRSQGEVHAPPVIQMHPPGEHPYFSIHADRVIAFTRVCSCGTEELCIALNKGDPNRDDGISMFTAMGRVAAENFIKMLQTSLDAMPGPQHEPEVRR